MMWLYRRSLSAADALVCVGLLARLCDNTGIGGGTGISIGYLLNLA